MLASNDVVGSAVTGVIAGVIAFLGVLLGLWVNASAERQRRRDELLLKAFEYLEGGSQRRSVGLAMLAVLRSSDARNRRRDRVIGQRPMSSPWLEDRDAILGLFYSQLLYLLVHGSNRWEAHEIANIERMMEWLHEEQDVSWLREDTERSGRLAEAIRSYLASSRGFEEWPADEKRKDGGRPSESGIRHLRDRLVQWSPSSLDRGHESPGSVDRDA